MMSTEEIARLVPAETASFRSPIPTAPFSSDEFYPGPQSAKQREFENRVKAIGTELAKKQGVSRRTFFQGAAGMAAAFVAMNDTFGPLYMVSRAEAQTPEMANARAAALKGQFIMDMHTHFLRDDTRIMGFVRQREAVGKAGWNPALAGKPQTIEDLKFANYFKEIYLDSDTKVALISGSGSEDPRDWFLTNEMKAETRADVNKRAGAKRMFSHAIFMPGTPGWLDKADKDFETLKPDSFKGYTVGEQPDAARPARRRHGDAAAALRSGAVACRGRRAQAHALAAGAGGDAGGDRASCLGGHGPVFAADAERGLDAGARFPDPRLP